MSNSIKSKFLSWRTIGISVLMCIVAGILGVTDPIDRISESAIGRLAWRSVSGDIVVVALDDRTLQAHSNSDFGPAEHGKIVDAINSAGAKRLFIDFLYDRRLRDRDFPKLTQAVKRMGDKAVLAVEAKSTRPEDTQISGLPNSAFGANAKHATIGWEYQFWQVWRLSTAISVNDRILPTFSSLMSGRTSHPVDTYAIDYSYRTDTIPIFSAVDVMEGKVGKRELAGKDVIFAATAATLLDHHYLPGHDRVPGAYIHVIGAETLKRGTPIDIGWLPALLAGSALTLLAIAYCRRLSMSSIGVIAFLLGAKLALTTILISMAVGPAILFTLVMGIGAASKRRRVSAQRENPLSGLPNFDALRDHAPFGNSTVIAAKVVNFEDLAAFLPSEGSQQLIDQVTRRLALACQDTRLHHDRDGSFAWLVPVYQHHLIEGQLSGLSALFNPPLIIGDQRVDVAIAFGVNDELEGSNAQRLAAALVAAERAIRTRALWTKYTPRQSEDAGWQLSFHSQLEDALTGGDIWVAYQPQYDLKTRSLVGVEALARWTHPTRGLIPPDEFIVQAEKSQDIYRLTLFVMDQAIRSAAELNARGHPVLMSVNLSAALLDHKDLVGTIRVMLTAHRLPPRLLTVEITETAQIENSHHARQTLAQLRRIGIRLSIDDYGTGQSNLEYLTHIEADEIKIDKRFVMTMRDSQRNLEVVKSTIDLAHRLGAVAVAEGIEDAQTLIALADMGCDVGQGYYLGKPQIFSELTAAAIPQNRRTSR